VVQQQLKPIMDDPVEAALETAPPDFTGPAAKDTAYKKNFVKQFGIMRGHVSVGLNQFGMGQYMFGLEGSYKVCMIQTGRLQGDLRAQVAQLRGMNAESLAACCEYVWEFSSDTSCPKGYGELLHCPPGFIMCQVGKQVASISQCYGAKGQAKDIVKASLELLFASWPEIKDGQYQTFYDSISSS
jgi:hypothetical protein